MVRIGPIQEFGSVSRIHSLPTSWKCFEYSQHVGNVSPKNFFAGLVISSDLAQPPFQRRKKNLALRHICSTSRSPLCTFDKCNCLFWTHHCLLLLVAAFDCSKMSSIWHRTWCGRSRGVQIPSMWCFTWSSSTFDQSKHEVLEIH